VNIHWPTPRLLLRAFQESDAHSFSAYRSDPQVAEYQGWNAPYSLEQAQKFVAEMSQATPGEPGEWYQIAIELKENGPESPGPLIGDVAFHMKEDRKQAYIGFTLARTYQGLGYAHEAVLRLLQHLFDERGLHRVIAITDVLNTPSIRLIERLGFRREAHFHENDWFKGRWSSEYWYALLAQEWVQRAA
jgi:RimJ/RimL family protein N-acetyltransferase